MTETLYDVFISHAFEDKNSFANELALVLKKNGLKVWYSGMNLKLGDSIAESINHALLKSKFGIVLISPVYLEKQWAMNELKALLSLEDNRNRILPILHNISAADISEHLPVLADRFSVSTSSGIQVVVNRVLQVIRGKRKYTRKAAAAKKPAAKTKKKKAAKKEKEILNYGFIALGGSMNIKSDQVAAGNISNRTQNEK